MGKQQLSSPRHSAVIFWVSQWVFLGLLVWLTRGSLMFQNGTNWVMAGGALQEILGQHGRKVCATVSMGHTQND